LCSIFYARKPNYILACLSHNCAHFQGANCFHPEYYIIFNGGFPSECDFLQICNMLKKKHEEAKDLLIRAIVNDNNLLMLNHPIYEEEISSHYFFVHFLLVI